MPDGASNWLTNDLVTRRYRPRPLRDLAPYARNSKIHTPEQIKALEKSLLEFGWTRPVAEADGTILAGHGIVAAALNLAQRGECPHDWPDPWAAPTVDLSHLNEQQRKAYVIADNRLAEKGTGWDNDMLAMELGELHEEGFTLDAIGFDAGDLTRLLGEHLPPTDPNAEWQGMPEFDQDDKMAFRTIKVHFNDQDAVDAFAALIQQKITDRTKFVWYPIAEIVPAADKRYASES